jgi:hypothetical protein
VLRRIFGKDRSFILYRPLFIGDIIDVTKSATNI